MKLVICRDCQVAVPRKKAGVHLGSHGITGEEKNQIIRDVYNGRNVHDAGSFEKALRGMQLPVAHIPIGPAYKCNDCGHINATLEGMFTRFISVLKFKRYGHMARHGGAGMGLLP